MARSNALKAVPAPEPEEAQNLGTFDGKEVAATSIVITNAGDGLSKAMQVDPVLLEHGERVVIVLEGEVVKVRMDPVSKDMTHLLVRVQIVKAETAALIDRDVVAKILDAQAEKIERAKGISRLPFPVDVLDDEDPEDDDL